MDVNIQKKKNVEQKRPAYVVVLFLSVEFEIWKILFLNWSHVSYSQNKLL